MRKCDLTLSKVRLTSLHIEILSIFSLVVGVETDSMGQTMHSTEKFYSMNLFKILCVVTWTWYFLTFMVMEAVRGQKHYSEPTLWHFNSLFGSSNSTISRVLEQDWRSWFLVSNKYLDTICLSSTWKVVCYLFLLGIISFLGK